MLSEMVGYYLEIIFLPFKFFVLLKIKESNTIK